MSIQTVTTIITDRDHVTLQLQAAAGFARAMDAHLHALVLVAGLDRAGIAHSAMDAFPVTVPEVESAKMVESLRDAVSDQLGREDVRWHVDALATAELGSVVEIVRHTKFSDLVVQQRTADETHPEAARLLAETVLFDADTPLLLLPEDSVLDAPPRKVMIAWDESAAALRATRAALPLLSEGAYVHVVLVDPPKDSPDRSDPGGAFAQFLARHGVKCEVSVCNRTDDSISATLERRALELGCDMLLMGAYGHSRLRQAIFGGTTRRILTQARVPVFMAH